jgi:hypothetical protein
MTRYIIAAGPQWLAAVYDPSTSGVVLTANKEDACSWATIRKPLEIIRYLQEAFEEPLELFAVDEPDYPKSWNLEESCV